MGKDADNVAAYIYESFYSKAAQGATSFNRPGSSFPALPSASIDRRSRTSWVVSAAPASGMTSAV